MKTIADPREMQLWAADRQREGVPTAFVPTMGCLHEGHLSLIRAARRLCERVVVSVFVNPIQFGPHEDFDAYPRDPERDAALCAAEGVDVFFSPEAADLYLPDRSTAVVEGSLSGGLCGASRPGHFEGVATVVCMLFNLVLPAVAVFGRKDAQQLAVIRRVVRDLHIPVRIVAAPTVREPDGLAMSSRNLRLAPDQRRLAASLYAALCEADRLFRSGCRDAGALREAVRDRLEGRAGLSIEYIEAVDAGTLRPVAGVAGPVLLALAARVGNVRLIDNVILGEAPSA